MRADEDKFEILCADTNQSHFSQEDIDVANSLGIILSGTAAECITRASEANRAATSLFLTAGYLLLKAKSELPHGEFGKYCKERDLESQRVSELMNIARLYTATPPGMRDRLLSVGKKKVGLLANSDREVVVEVFNDPDDNLETLSVRGLREKIRKLEENKSTLSEELAIHEKRLRGLSETRRLTSFTAHTEDTRRECLALQAEAELPIVAFEQLVDNILNEDHDAPEWRIRAEQAWITGTTIASRAAMLLETLRANLGDLGMPDHISAEHWLTAEEAERWLIDYKRLCDGHASRSTARIEERENARPRGRGRPKGSGKR